MNVERENRKKAFQFADAAPNPSAHMKRLELLSKRLVTGDMLGNYRSAFRGTGLTFSETREYQPGDEIRRIDWKVTARSRHPHVKLFDEERLLSVYGILDQSLSMKVGSELSAQRNSEHFLALIAALVAKSRDQLGLFTFGGPTNHFFSASSRTSQVRRFLLQLEETSQQTDAGVCDFNQSMRTFLQRVKRPGLLFILSDFLFDIDTQLLQSLCKRHDVVFAMIDRNFVPPDARGLVLLHDPETGEEMMVDLSSSGARKKLEFARQRSRDHQRELIRSSGGDFMLLGSDPVAPLADLMRARMKNRNFVR